MTWIVSGLKIFTIFFFSLFALGLVSIEKINQTLKTVFEHISKHLEVRQKYSATRRDRIFNSLLGVWKCGQTPSFMFDVLFLMSRKLYCTDTATFANENSFALL